MENFPVYANVTGIVSEIMVEEGDYIKTGSPLVKVANLNSVWAIFDAYENQLSLFKEGQTLDVSTNSYPNETFTAKVSFVAPLLNKQTRTLEVRAELDNKKGMLKPGMMNGSYAVNSGLQSGEMIVAKGTFTVDAAAQLQGKKSMMNQDGEAMQMDHEGHSEMGSIMKMEFSQEAGTKFGDLLKVYLDLKDALVASDQEQTQALAKNGAGIASELSGMQMDDMGKSHITQLANQLKEMGSKSDLEGQRETFVLLSQNMIQIGQQMQGLDAKIYVQHCPMANNDKGANWLSMEEEIRNPYYGDAMLTCGSVVGAID